MAGALVIDDDAHLLGSIEGAARAAGLAVATAASWDEGLALFQVLNPHVIIADYNMPGSQNGLKLLARVRKLSPSLRLVLFSGYLDADDMARVSALGIVDRTLTKGSAFETAEAVLDEARQAAAKADEPTDWVEYAAAFVGARASDDDVAKLDRILVGKIGAPDARI